jgi:hypothetical protein
LLTNRQSDSRRRLLKSTRKEVELHCPLSFDPVFRTLIFMPFSPLSVEVVFELLTVLPDRVVLSPILITVLKDEPDICFELARSFVYSVNHLGPNGAEVHGALHDIEIVWHVISSWINGLLERANETSPEARSANHALYQAPAELQLLLGGHRSGRYGGATTDATDAIGLSSNLLDSWFNLDSAVNDYIGLDSGSPNALHASRLFCIDIDVLVVNLIFDWLRGWHCHGRKVTHDYNQLTEYFLRKCPGEFHANGGSCTHYQDS